MTSRDDGGYRGARTRGNPALTPERFTRLYDESAPALARWLRSRVDREVAQELLAETFAAAWCARRSYSPVKGEAQAWLFGIASNLTADYFRRLAVESRARRKLGVATGVNVGPSEDSERRLDARAWTQRLRSALAALPRPTRDAVALRVVEELDYDEVAVRLGCSSEAARLRVSRGLRALRAADELCETEGAVA